jgi:hypothetical protein
LTNIFSGDLLVKQNSKRLQKFKKISKTIGPQDKEKQREIAKIKKAELDTLLRR